MAYRDEIARLEAMHAANPEGRVFAHLAEAYRKGGELERARQVLTEGLERHPGYASAHVVMGRVLLDLREREPADAAFRRVLELDPHNMVALRARADIAHDAGQRAEAVHLYRELLAVDPSDSHAAQRIEEIEAGPADAPGAPAPAEPVDEVPDFSTPELRKPEAEAPGPPAAAPIAPAEPPAPEYGEAALEEIVSAGALDEPSSFDAMDLGADLEQTPTHEPATGDVDLGLGDMIEPTDLGAAATPADAALDLGGLEGSFDLADVDETEAQAVEPEAALDLPGFDEIAGDATPEQTLPTAPADEPAPAPAPAPAPFMSEGEAEPEAEPEFHALWSAHDDGDAAALPDIGPELVTETIADLYAQQGLYERAADVYARVLEKRPGDAAIQTKLDAARSAIAAADDVIGAWAARTEAERHEAPEPEQPEIMPAPAPVDLPAPAFVDVDTPDLPSAESAAVFDLPALEDAPEPAFLDLPPLDADADDVSLDLPPLEPEGEPEPFDLPLLESEAIPAEPIQDGAIGDGATRDGATRDGAIAAEAPAAPESAAPEAIESVEAAWTGGAGAAAPTDSPFGWAEPEAAPEQSTIGEYLEGLLAWQPPAAPEPEPVAAPEPEPEPVAAAEPEPEPVAVPEPAAPEPQPAAPEPQPAAPEAASDDGIDDIDALFGGITPTPDAAPAPQPEPARPPEPEPAAQAAPTPAPPATAGVDDIDALFGDLPATKPAAATDDALSWLDQAVEPKPPAAPSPAPVPVPTPEPEPEHPHASHAVPTPEPEPTPASNAVPTPEPEPASNAVPAQPAGFEWDPFAELPADEPAPAPVPAPAVEAEPAPEAAAEADDDEDIDMFRAWLQSLKR